MQVSGPVESPRPLRRAIYELGGARRLPERYTHWVERDIESGRWWTRLRRWSATYVAIWVAVLVAATFRGQWASLITEPRTTVVAVLVGVPGAAAVGLTVTLIAASRALDELRSSLEKGAESNQRGETKRPFRILWLPVHPQLGSAMARQTWELRRSFLLGIALVATATFIGMALTALVG